MNCSGFSLPRAPKWAASVGYEHTFNFSGGSAINAAREPGSTLRNATPDSSSLARSLPTPTQTYDVDLTYLSRNGKWSLRAFVHNVGNEPVYTGRLRARLRAAARVRHHRPAAHVRRPRLATTLIEGHRSCDEA